MSSRPPEPAVAIAAEPLPDERATNHPAPSATATTTRDGRRAAAATAPVGRAGSAALPSSMSRSTSAARLV